MLFGRRIEKHTKALNFTPVFLILHLFYTSTPARSGLLPPKGCSLREKMSCKPSEKQVYLLFRGAADIVAKRKHPFALPSGSFFGPSIHHNEFVRLRPILCYDVHENGRKVGVFDASATDFVHFSGHFDMTYFLLNRRKNLRFSKKCLSCSSKKICARRSTKLFYALPPVLWTSGKFLAKWIGFCTFAQYG